MVDKYFNFVYALEDSVYHFEDRHVDDRFNNYNQITILFHCIN
jgi:Mg2+ and Co2+ transporter CorA